MPKQQQQQQHGAMVAASSWRPRQPSSEGSKASDQTSTAPATRIPGPAGEMVRQPFFREWETPHRLSSPKYRLCQQALRIPQWNAKSLAQKSMNSDSYSRAKLLAKDTTPSFLGICVIRADLPTNQRGGGLLILIRDNLVFQKAGDAYSPPLQRLTVQAQLSRRK